MRATPGPVLEALSDNLRSILDLAGPDTIGAASDLFRVIWPDAGDVPAAAPA